MSVVVVWEQRRSVCHPKWLRCLSDGVVTPARACVEVQAEPDTAAWRRDERSETAGVV